MTLDAPRARSPRRIVLEVAALGTLVILAVALAQGTDPDRNGEAAAHEAAAHEPAAHEPAAHEPASEPELEQTPIPGSLPIPSAPETWKAMSHEDLESVGRRVAEITPGFRFDRVEVFGGAGLSNAIAVLVHEQTELEFSLIPPGSFLMGSPESEAGRFGDEGPRHRVTFGRAFLIARTECTQASWDRIGGEDDRRRAGERLPIASVSWDAVTSWCGKADLRLPSEAEWEYACRGAVTPAYWAGDDEADLARVGWYRDNSGGGTHPVGEKPANPFGLFDVHGNVWEWCEDDRHHSYRGAPADGSAWIDPASVDRVIRGGGFDGVARDARSAFRSWSHPGARWPALGFRPARSVTAD